MAWAGPIEFSTGEIIAILLVMAAMALAVPVIAGTVAVVLYRRRTPAEEQTRRAATVRFFQVFALALLGQVVLGALIGLVQELIG